VTAFRGNIIDQDQLRRPLGPRFFPVSTLAGYEAIHMIRKGQASGSASAPGIGLLHRFILGLFAATS